MSASLLPLPQPVLDVFEHFRTCEFTTINKAGMPSTWPVTPLYLPAEGQFLLTSSIAMSNKLIHIRRNSHVAMFFSEPKASGLTNPPIVLVQGDATASDELVTSVNRIKPYWRRLMQFQPPSKMWSSTPVMRWLADWYYVRILTYISPRRILWWASGDQSQPAQMVEVA